jgi:hypothetical protein
MNFMIFFSKYCMRELELRMQATTLKSKKWRRNIGGELIKSALGSQLLEAFGA